MGLAANKKKEELIASILLQTGIVEASPTSMSNQNDNSDKQAPLTDNIVDHENENTSDDLENMSPEKDHVESVVEVDLQDATAYLKNVDKDHIDIAVDIDNENDDLQNVLSEEHHMDTEVDVDNEYDNNDVQIQSTSLQLDFDGEHDSAGKVKLRGFPSPRGKRTIFMSPTTSCAQVDETKPNEAIVFVNGDHYNFNVKWR